MAKSKEAASSVNPQVVDAVTENSVKALDEWQQQTAQGAYQLLEIGMQNNQALQQLTQDSLGLMSGWYKSYFESMNGMTQHSWAAYSSLLMDPWGLSTLMSESKEK